MERLDLDSIERTQLLVSRAAKDKILLKPTRTSTRQPVHKQHNSTTQPDSLPKLAEALRSQPVILRGNQQSVSDAGICDVMVTVSSDKPHLPTLTSGQMKVDTGSSRTGNRLQMFTATVSGHTGNSLLASPTSTTTLAPLSTTTTTLSPRSTVTTVTSPRTKLPPSTTTATLASWLSHTKPASSQSTIPVGGPSVHRTCLSNESPMSSSQLDSLSDRQSDIQPDRQPDSQPDRQPDSLQTDGEIKPEISIKSMRSRFQPPLSSNKCSQSRSVRGTELDTNTTSSREESHTRPRPGHHLMSLPVPGVKPADSSVTSPLWATVITTSATNTTKVRSSSSAAVLSAAVSAPEASWFGKKRELLVGVDNNTSATAANSLTNSSVARFATAANSPTTVNSPVTMSNSPTTVNSPVTMSNSPTTVNSPVTMSNSPTTVNNALSMSNSPTTVNNALSMSNSPTTVNNHVTMSNSPTTVNNALSVSNSLTNSSVSKSATQENMQRWFSRTPDQPFRKMSTSSSLESKMAGLQKQDSHLTTDETDFTRQNSSQITATQINYVKSSRSFFDCSSRLNTQTNSVAANTCRSTTHLASTSQTVLPGSVGAEAERKTGTLVDEQRPPQRQSAMSAFFNRPPHAKVVSSVSAAGLPSHTVSNKTPTSLAASDLGNSATSSSSGATTMAVQQSGCMQASLGKSITNTAQLASSAKPASLLCKTGSQAVTSVSTGASSQTGSKAATAVSTGASSQTGSQAVTAVSTGASSQTGSKAATAVSTGASSQTGSKAATAVSTGASSQTGSQAVTAVSTGASSQTGSKAATNVFTDGLCVSTGYSHCAVFASPATGQATPRISSFRPCFSSSSSSVASTTSCRLSSALPSVPALSSVVSTISSHLASATPSMSASSVAAISTNSVLTCSLLGKSYLTQLGKPQVLSTTTSVKQTASSTHTTPNLSTTPSVSGNKLPKTNYSGASTARDKPMDTGIKEPAWRTNQLKKNVQVKIVERNISDHVNILEPSKKIQSATDAAIFEQTDKLCLKPSKVFNMLKNFQTCQKPS